MHFFLTFLLHLFTASSSFIVGSRHITQFLSSNASAAPAQAPTFFYPTPSISSAPTALPQPGYAQASLFVSSFLGVSSTCDLNLPFSLFAFGLNTCYRTIENETSTITTYGSLKLTQASTPSMLTVNLMHYPKNADCTGPATLLESSTVPNGCYSIQDGC